MCIGSMHTCRAICLCAETFAYMQSRLFMCSGVCLYAAPTADLQSGVHIGKATCSCARVGFRRHVVFSMKYKPQARLSSLLLDKLPPGFSSSSSCIRPSGPARKRTAARQSCGIQQPERLPPNRVFPKTIPLKCSVWMIWQRKSWVRPLITPKCGLA